MLRTDFMLYNPDGTSEMHNNPPQYKQGNGKKHDIHPSKEYNQMRIRHLRIETAATLWYVRRRVL